MFTEKKKKERGFHPGVVDSNLLNAFYGILEVEK